MRKLAIYYFQILMPFPLLIASTSYPNPLLFVILAFSYVIFRGVVDGQALVEKGAIEKRDAWKAFIPFWTQKYFRQLYFEGW